MNTAHPGIYDALLSREVYASDFASRTPQPKDLPLSIAEAFRAWFGEVEMFRNGEDEILGSGEKIESSGHRAVLPQLIAMGEMLLLQATDSDMKACEFTGEDVRATLKFLRISDRCSYENTSTPESRKALIEALADRV